MSDLYESDEHVIDVQAAFDTATDRGVTSRPDTITRRGAHADKLRATAAKKLDELFAGRTFDIVSEIHLDENQVFRTYTGARARHGYILKDRASGEQIAVGTTMLKIIHRRYLGVSLPPDKRRKHNRNRSTS